MRILPLSLLLTVMSLTFCAQKEAPKVVAETPITPTPTPPVVTDTAKKLVWSDEFNTPGHPDTTKWNYNIGNGDGGWGNNELEYYTNSDSNARIENGNLVIEARKESLGGRNYTSARMLTQGKFDWTYGRFEIRAKLPKGIGTWPAIWMLGSNIPQVGWPTCGEIDIMEHVGKNLNEINWSAHSKMYNWPMGTQKTNKAIIANVTDSFHVYKLDWSKAALNFYVDDALYLTVNSDGKNADYYPFVVPQFLLLNLAIGGNMAGSTIDNSIFPVRMLVDYVRVYQ
jgi:beta-glucanase (GH16 family)